MFFQVEVKNISTLSETEIEMIFNEAVNNQNAVKKIEKIEMDQFYNTFIIEFHNAEGEFIRWFRF
jgi:hypothetical protein